MPTEKPYIPQTPDKLPKKNVTEMVGIEGKRLVRTNIPGYSNSYAAFSSEENISENFADIFVGESIYKRVLSSSEIIEKSDNFEISVTPRESGRRRLLIALESHSFAIVSEASIPTGRLALTQEVVEHGGASYLVYKTPPIDLQEGVETVVSVKFTTIKELVDIYRSSVRSRQQESNNVNFEYDPEKEYQAATPVVFNGRFCISTKKLPKRTPPGDKTDANWIVYYDSDKDIAQDNQIASIEAQEGSGGVVLGHTLLTIGRANDPDYNHQLIGYSRVDGNEIGSLGRELDDKTITIDALVNGEVLIESNLYYQGEQAGSVVEPVADAGKAFITIGIGGGQTGTEMRWLESLERVFFGGLEYKLGPVRDQKNLPLVAITRNRTFRVLLDIATEERVQFELAAFPDGTEIALAARSDKRIAGAYEFFPQGARLSGIAKFVEQKASESLSFGSIPRQTSIHDDDKVLLNQEEDQSVISDRDSITELSSGVGDGAVLGGGPGVEPILSRQFNVNNAFLQTFFFIATEGVSSVGIGDDGENALAETALPDAEAGKKYRRLEIFDHFGRSVEGALLIKKGDNTGSWDVTLIFASEFHAGPAILRLRNAAGAPSFTDDYGASSGSINGKKAGGYSWHSVTSTDFLYFADIETSRISIHAPDSLPEGQFHPYFTISIGNLEISRAGVKTSTTGQIYEEVKTKQSAANAPTFNHINQELNKLYSALDTLRSQFLQQEPEIDSINGRTSSAPTFETLLGGLDPVKKTYTLTVKYTLEKQLQVTYAGVEAVATNVQLTINGFYTYPNVTLNDSGTTPGQRTVSFEIPEDHVENIENNRINSRGIGTIDLELSGTRSVTVDDRPRLVSERFAGVRFLIDPNFSEGAIVHPWALIDNDEPIPNTGKKLDNAKYVWRETVLRNFGTNRSSRDANYAFSLDVGSPDWRTFDKLIFILAQAGATSSQWGPLRTAITNGTRPIPTLAQRFEPVYFQFDVGAMRMVGGISAIFDIKDGPPNRMWFQIPATGNQFGANSRNMSGGVSNAIGDFAVIGVNHNPA